MQEHDAVDKSPTIAIDDSNVKPSALDFETGIKHILGPAVIGMLLGILAEHFVTPNYPWPSPPQAAKWGQYFFLHYYTLFFSAMKSLDGGNIQSV